MDSMSSSSLDIAIQEARIAIPSRSVLTSSVGDYEDDLMREPFSQSLNVAQSTLSVPLFSSSMSVEESDRETRMSANGLEKHEQLLSDSLRGMESPSNSSSMGDDLDGSDGDLDEQEDDNAMDNGESEWDAPTGKRARQTSSRSVADDRFELSAHAQNKLMRHELPSFLDSRVRWSSELLVEHLTTTTTLTPSQRDELRRFVRVMKNRESAYICRERRRARMREILVQRQELEDEAQQLKIREAELQAERLLLEEKLSLARSIVSRAVGSMLSARAKVAPVTCTSSTTIASSEASAPAAASAATASTACLLGGACDTRLLAMALDPKAEALSLSRPTLSLGASTSQVETSERAAFAGMPDETRNLFLCLLLRLLPNMSGCSLGMDAPVRTGLPAASYVPDVVRV